MLEQPESQVKAVHRTLPDFLRLRGGALAFDHFSMAEWLTRETDEGFARADEFAVDVSASEAALHRWAVAKVRAAAAHRSAYLLRHLASHLAEADERKDAFTRLMLSDFAWLNARLRLSGVEALVADCVLSGDTEETRLLRALWRNSAYVLQKFPAQLAAQLLGRLHSLRDAVPALNDMADCTMRWLERPFDATATDERLVPTAVSLRLSAALIETFTGHEAPVNALAVLPDGRIASAAHDRTVRVWDPCTAGQPALFVADASITALLALSDERIVAGCRRCGAFPAPHRAPNYILPVACQPRLFHHKR